MNKLPTQDCSSLGLSSGRDRRVGVSGLFVLCGLSVYYKLVGNNFLESG